MVSFASTGAPGRFSRGFTLLELIVVITIIGILSTIVVLKVSYWPDRTRDLKVQEDCAAILRGAEMYSIVKGQLPATLDELIEATDESGKPLGLLDKKPVDPWGTEYQYSLVDGKPEVKCLGSDKAEGGVERAADVVFTAK